MAFGQYSGGIGAVIGGVIGGIIGAYTPIGPYQGAMLGASLGGTAGGIAGQVFWPEKIDITHPLPPKPHESRVQISTYGAPIPIVYESARVAGNIIYMSDVVETIDRSRHRQDGVRYYEMEKTYTATFAIAFSEGEVVGLSRIWVNGKIFADYRDPASPYYPTGSIALASANLSTTIARAVAYYSVYLGTETQTSDSALSALLTAAETPTYRGIFYIVFRDFPVGEFSGVPTIEVEIDTPIDACSEYYTGTDGASPSTAIYTGRGGAYNTGTAPTIQSNTLQFYDASGQRNEYNAYFSFNSEFDINLDFEITSLADSQPGWIYIGVDYGYFMVFNFTVAPGDTRNYEAQGDVYTEQVSTDTSGKLRIRRDASWDVYGYYWNSSLSRWEWNGDTNGILLGNTGSPSSLMPQFGAYTGDGTTIRIGDVIVTSGCGDITV